jgi:Transglutaminase-like superfamily
MSWPFVTVLQPGDAGTEDTLLAMREMAHASVPVLPPWLPTDAGAIHDWLAAHVRFRADPIDRETVESPAAMLDQVMRQGVAYGDCDDLAVLAAGLGLRAGLVPRFRVVAFDRYGPYAHVWTELVHPLTGWVEDLDLFRPDHPPVIRREAVVEV